MNINDSAVDDFLTAHTGSAITVALDDGSQIVGTASRAAAYDHTDTDGNSDWLLLIVDESVAGSFGVAPSTRRWFVDLAHVTALTS